METGWAKSQEAEMVGGKKKETLNLYGILGAKYSDLLGMHEANCNMVFLCKTYFCLQRACEAEVMIGIPLIQVTS